MALSTKPRGVWWSRLHFLVRFAGLTGLAAAGIGLALVYLHNTLGLFTSSWSELREALPRVLPDMLLGKNGAGLDRVAGMLFVGGFLVALVALLVEILSAVRVLAGRRSAFGLSAVVQILLASAILVGVNVYSFQHYFRLDWTRDRQFTLPANVRDQLAQLQGETTIVLYQQHKASELSDKPDGYDYAAEAKVVEKVQDLVEQFRELGPRFNVVVLDVKDKLDTGKKGAGTARQKREDSYQQRFEKLPEELKTAINSAADNSIFFYAHEKGAGKVQRLSFNDFYRLDKERSEDEGNLVLLDQGIEPFSRKVLNIDQKKPRVGILVVHEVLTSESTEDLGLAGLRKALTERGFEVRDIVLKKWSEFGPPEPAVLTYEENKYERLEDDLAALKENIQGLQEALAGVTSEQDLWKKASLDELNKKYADQLQGRRITQATRRAELDELERNKLILQKFLEEYQAERDATVKDKADLNIDSAAEQRRIADLKAKLTYQLNDCDLLFIPRMTLRNVNISYMNIPNRAHQLDEAQVAAIEDFVKYKHRPILACLGPVNDPPDRMDLSAGAPDGLERFLEQLGFKLARQTVLFNSELKSFAERRSGLVFNEKVEVPPIAFDWKPGETQRGLLAAAREGTADLKPNPLRESMRILLQNPDLRLRHPRPIAFEPLPGRKMSFDPEFMVTNQASWKADQPFPTREQIPSPRGKPPGPIPIGVAVETTLPGSWNDGSVTPATVRVAVIGHGGVFSGAELSPATEGLLLNTCNWLLGRDDLLPRGDHVWQYPRVHLGESKDEERNFQLWHWGTQAVLPGAFAYLGFVVLMVRRLR